MWTGRMLASTAFAVGALAALALPGAARADDREALVALYKVAISADACNFEMSDDQAEAIGAAMDELVGKMQLSDDDADKLYLETENALGAADWDKVCDPRGAWAAAYNDIVAKYGK
ncbi:MAG TPA: hypothetical protein PLJ34_08865 [Hyphomicrobiales bacterium]|nr:hypothetical protein [Hyphomicrobiales bacterium]